MSETSNQTAEFNEVVMESPIDGNSMAPDSNHPLPDSVEAEHGNAPSVELEVDNEAKTTAQAPLEGYELVASLMRRQDEVLERIDQLDKQIIAMIDQITAEREAEKAAEIAALDAGEAELLADEESRGQIAGVVEAAGIEQSDLPSEMQTPIQRAA